MRRWCCSNDFYKKTGTTREKVHFCREWDEKADVCKELGVTVVVESSSSSAGSLESVVETALLFGDGADVLQGSKPRQDGDEGAQALLWWDSVCSELMPPHKAVEQVADSGKKVQGEGEGVKDTGKKSESKDKIGEKVVKQLEGKKEKGVDEDEQFFSGDEDQES